MKNFYFSVTNSNCYNTKENKNIIEIVRKGKKIDKIIASNEYVFRPQKTGNIN